MDNGQEEKLSKGKWFSAEVTLAHTGAGRDDKGYLFAYGGDSSDARSVMQRMDGWKKNPFINPREMTPEGARELLKLIRESGLEIKQVLTSGFYGRRRDNPEITRAIEILMSNENVRRHNST